MVVLNTIPNFPVVSVCVDGCDIRGNQVHTYVDLDGISSAAYAYAYIRDAAKSEGVIADHIRSVEVDYGYGTRTHFIDPRAEYLIDGDDPDEVRSFNIIVDGRFGEDTAERICRENGYGIDTVYINNGFLFTIYDNHSPAWGVLRMTYSDFDNDLWDAKFWRSDDRITRMPSHQQLTVNRADHFWHGLEGSDAVTAELQYICSDTLRPEGGRRGY